MDQSEEALKVANKLISQNQKIESTFDRLEDEIAYIYFLTDHFVDFVAIYSKLNLNNYSVEWLPPYFYSLYKSVGLKMMEKASENLIRHKENEMQEALEEDDAEWEPGRRLEYINEVKSDIDFIKTTVREISLGKNSS
ncbi:MAG: hypothetical protein Q8934_16700 [Bacillota bacterium]|nr:hypothetical protein [Bacillota bacterium]